MLSPNKKKITLARIACLYMFYIHGGCLLEVGRLNKQIQYMNMFGLKI